MSTSQVHPTLKVEIYARKYYIYCYLTFYLFISSFISKKLFITCKGPAPIPSFPEHWKPQQGEGYEAVVHSFEWHPFVSWIIPFAELKIIGQKTNFDIFIFIPRYDA